MKFTRLSVIAALLLGMSCVWLSASVNDLPVREVNGRHYHYYEVAPKETVYSICHRLGVSKEELVKCNPAVADGLKAGTVLFFPIDDAPLMSASGAASASQGTTIITHKVEKGETIYGIATQYGLSTQEVMEQNPIVSDGLKAGQTLHLTIPAKNTPAAPAAHVSAVPAQAPVASTPDEGYIVKKKETFYSIANAHGITVAQLEAANPGITILKEGQVLTIPGKVAAAPAVAATTTVPAAPVQDVTPDNGGAVIPSGQSISVDEFAAASGVPEKKTEISIAVILPFMLNEAAPSKGAQRYTEFYKGFLLAIDSLRNNGTPVRISAYDTEGSTAKLNEIIAKPELKNHRLIIAPDNAEHLAMLGEYGRVNNIKVLNDFIVRDETFRTNPAVMQGNIPSGDMLNKAVRGMADRVAYTTPVFINQTDGAKDKGDFTDALKKRLDEKGIAYKTVNVDGRLTSAHLRELAKDGNYTFITNTSRQSDVNRLLPGLIEWRDDAGTASVRIVGYPEWITFRGETLTNMHNLNTLVYSRFFDDDSSYRSRRVEGKFKEWYGTGMENAIPRQGMLGFDTGMFAIKYQKDPHVRYDGVQNGFQFTVPEGAAGDCNNLLYIINYRPGGLIEKMTL